MQKKNFDAFIRSHPRLYRLFVTGQGKIVLAQPPNWQLISYAVLKVLSLILPGQYGRTAAGASVIAILLWSLLELFLGVNLFRRLLGAAVLVGMGIG